MRPIMWGENTWLCAVCGSVETSPNAPADCWTCDESEAPASAADEAPRSEREA